VVDILPSKPEAAATLFRTDGSIDMPHAVTEDLEAVTSNLRKFSYQLPGLTQSRSFAQRPQVLAYETTRFDKHWIDEKDIVTEALDKVVEKTTVTVKIPVPRSPGTKVVCTVSLLAAGGSCNIVNIGQGFVVVLNDPETLNNEEDQRCQAWWAEVVTATTPERWRAAQDRYDAQCRKPLASDDEPKN